MPFRTWRWTRGTAATGAAWSTRSSSSSLPPPTATACTADAAEESSQGAAPAAVATAGGMDDTPPPPLTAYEDALDALKRIDAVSIVAVPDRTDTAFQAKLVLHCEQTRDRVAVLDADSRRVAVRPARSRACSSTGRALSSAAATQRSTTRGCGDRSRQHHRRGRDPRPAVRRGRRHLRAERRDPTAACTRRRPTRRSATRSTSRVTLTDAEQGELNVEGVNVIRLFPGIGRPLVWGARTIAPTASDRLALRERAALFLYIEESLQEGLHPWVFDPNDLGLWKRLDRTVIPSS